jgi:hypothetical protein
VIGALLGDLETRRRLGARALKVVQENRGAIERTVDLILSRLDTGEFYVARSS